MSAITTARTPSPVQPLSKSGQFLRRDGRLYRRSSAASSAGFIMVTLGREDGSTNR